MNVQTLFFASYRDLLGTHTTEVDLPEGSTVDDLVRALKARGGSYAALPDDPPVAVNQRWVGREAALTAGDEVAFLPPVAGG